MKSFEKKLTAITTCKGRLHHLKQTLPFLANKENVEVIVVDYGCPDNAGDWVSKNYPSVRVVKQTDDQGFCAARARNIGASMASTEWLLFIDADIKAQGMLLDWAANNLRAESFYLSPNLVGDLYGTFFTSRKAFEKIGGYDECFRDWGGEDNDIYYRLVRSGQLQKNYAEGLFEPIPHSNEERFKFAENQDVSQTKDFFTPLNVFYGSVKYDLEGILNANLSEKDRKTIRDLVKQTLKLKMQNNQPSDFKIDLGERLDCFRESDIKITRSLVYTIASR